MELNLLQIEALASLKDNHGFQLLLNIMDKEVDELLNELRMCPNQFLKNSILSLWESGTWTIKKLREIPDLSSQELQERNLVMAEEALGTKGYVAPDILMQLLNEYKKRQNQSGDV